MSFKGITWAGNVYQKFETMCLEVEEAMYQDTVKYMENQVQKVGVSVKKFCSEVMDDIRPLSCIDPMSLASTDLSLMHPGYTDIDKKPIPSTLDSGWDLKKNEDQVIPNATELFSPQSPGILIEHKSPEKFAASKKIGVQRRLIGIKRISKIDHPSKDSCRATSESKDRRSKVANCDKSTISRMASDNSCVMSSSDFNVKQNVPNHDSPIESPDTIKGLFSETVRQGSSRAACNDSDVTASSNLVMHEPGEAAKGSTPLEDNLIESTVPKKVSSAESTRQTEDVSDSISPASGNNLADESVRLKRDTESTPSCPDSPTESTGTSVDDNSFSAACSSFRSNVCDIENKEKGVTVSDEGTSMIDGLPSVDFITWNAESCNKDFITSNKESFDIEFVENNEAAEPRSENFFETSGRHDLDESCILVDEDELICALQGTRKHKSYKKRIREALASKLRSKKHEQLVSLHKQESTSVRLGEEEISARDSVELDWELL